MHKTFEGVTERASAHASLAIDNLRTVLVLFVVAVHASLAYMSFLPHKPFAFGMPPFSWRSFPIVDSQRLIGFDLFCAWVDVFVMATLFLVSGLFVWPSLERKGALRFAAERVRRLGLPFAAGVLLLMPLAHYPVYAQSNPHPDMTGFVHQFLALPFWPAGPLWFLWVLLLADILAALLFLVLRRQRAAAARLATWSSAHAGSFLGGMLVASTIGYVTFATIFGAMPWLNFGPLSIQLSRPVQYAVYFSAGVIMGAAGLGGTGLLGPSGAIVRHWRGWVAAAVLTFIVWLGVSAKVVLSHDPAPTVWQATDAVAYVTACFSSCFCAIALAVRSARVTNPWLENLQRNAYGIYVVHFVFVVWLQFALLSVNLPAALKFLTVLLGTLGLSWLVTEAKRRLASAMMRTAAQQAVST